MFYERFVYLCQQKGVSTSRAAMEAGLSKSTVSKWKSAPNSRPSGNIINKLCSYFGLTVAELLNEPEAEPEPPVRTPPSREEIKFALFGGSGDITDEMYQEVLDFAAYVRHREAKKQRDTT